MAKRHVSSVPRQRYMSVNLGQLFVADIREVFPGDFIRHRCRIGVHLAPMQAPELAPMIIRQDTFFVPNRILWDYWDNYISQKLLEDSTVGPFTENKLLPPQVVFFMGSGYNYAPNSTGESKHLTNVRGVYDLLEGLGIKFSYMDTYDGSSDSGFSRTCGGIVQLNAFALMAYWRIWHDFYRDAYLQNDSFSAITSGRIPLQGDPWADEQPIDDEGTGNSENWNTPVINASGFSSFTTAPGRSLPGYRLSFYQAGAALPPHNCTRGIFSFAKRQPAMAVAVRGQTDATSAILPGVCCVIPLDLAGVTAGSEPTFSLGMYAPVCMPKDYIFAARQSPVYNSDIATPDTMRDIRKAFQVLGYREKIVRFDNRIKAWLYNMFHVNVSDKRLDSPLWLCGSQSIINTQEILGTVNNADTVLGQLGGFGIGAVRGRTCKFRSEDHGYLMTLGYISVLPVYGDGVQRFHTRGVVQWRQRVPKNDGALDYPLPDFARIGQQGMYIGEVSVNPRTSADTTTVDFWNIGGYTDRYADLDFGCSDVCGDFRTTLRFWHTGLFFSEKTNVLSNVGELNRFQGVNGDFVSLFNRNFNNTRVLRSGGTRSTISSMIQGRLFDSGISADAFWIVASSDYIVSRRLPVHAHPGYADHTSGVIR